MRRKDREVLEPVQIEAVVRSACVCRIALCDGNMPYVVPVNYGYEDGTLYVHSAREGRKIDLIRKNDNVCFEVESGVELVPGKTRSGCTMRYASVIGCGKAVLVDDPQEKKRGLEIILRQHAVDRYEMPEELVNRTLLIRIRIDSITGKASGEPGA